MTELTVVTCENTRCPFNDNDKCAREEMHVSVIEDLPWEPGKILVVCASLK